MHAHADIDKWTWWVKDESSFRCADRKYSLFWFGTDLSAPQFSLTTQATVNLAIHLWRKWQPGKTVSQFSEFVFLVVSFYFTRYENRVQRDGNVQVSRFRTAGSWWGRSTRKSRKTEWGGWGKWPDNRRHDERVDDDMTKWVWKLKATCDAKGMSKQRSIRTPFSELCEWASGQAGGRTSEQEANQFDYVGKIGLSCVGRSEMCIRQLELNREMRKIW